MAKSLKKNYLYSLTYQVLTLITPFVTTPYVSRVLGAEGVGVASYVTAVVFYFTLVAALGTGTVGQREVAYQRDDKEKRSEAFWNAQILNFAAVFVAMLVYGAFIAWQTENQVYYRILFLNIFTVAVDVVWFFQGMEEFQKIVIRNIIFKFVGIIYLFLFVKTADDVDIYLLGTALTALVSALSLWTYLPRYVQRVPWHRIKLKATFRQSLLLFIPTVAVSAYVVLDKVMLGWFTAAYAENGYYEQAMKIAKMSLMLIFSLSSVMTPRISYCFQQRDWESLRGYMYKSFRLLWLISCPVCFGLWGIMAEFVPWFFGPGFEQVTELVDVLALLVPIQGLTIIMGGQFLVSIKEERFFTYSVITGASLNIVLNLLLIPRYFAMGAAVASILGEMGVALVQIYYARRYLSMRNIFAPIRRCFIAAAGMGTGIFLLTPYIGAGMQHTIISILLGIGIYGIVLVFLRDEFVISVLRKSCKKISFSRIK